MDIQAKLMLAAIAIWVVNISIFFYVNYVDRLLGRVSFILYKSKMMWISNIITLGATLLFIKFCI